MLYMKGQDCQQGLGPKEVEKEMAMEAWGEVRE